MIQFCTMTPQRNPARPPPHLTLHRRASPHPGKQARPCPRYVGRSNYPLARRKRWLLLLQLSTQPAPRTPLASFTPDSRTDSRFYRRSPEELSEALMLPMIKDRSVQIQVRRQGAASECPRFSWCFTRATVMLSQDGRGSAGGYGVDGQEHQVICCRYFQWQSKL